MTQMVKSVAIASKKETEKSFSNDGFSNFKNGFKKDKGVCPHCGLIGHAVDKCYKLHGYPPGYKFKNKNVGQSNSHGHGYSKKIGSSYGNHFKQLQSKTIWVKILTRSAVFCGSRLSVFLWTA